MLKDNLTQWHRIVAEKDWEGLHLLLDEDVEFHSPFVWKPKKGRATTAFILSNVTEVMENFKYHREWMEGNDAVLEFSAQVEGLDLKGIDLIRFNDQGKIIHFEVFIRPANALVQVGQMMTKRLESAGRSV